MKLPRTLAQARFDWGELSGSLGDLGTFLPLLTAMASQNGLDFSTALFFAGVFNLITALIFAVPMAVQPMKAIAAVALSQGLSAGEIVAAGMIVSVVVLVLGVTGAIAPLMRVIPKPVIRGVQLATGLLLTGKGFAMISATGSGWGLNSWAMAGAAALLVLVVTPLRRFPSALVLFVAGLAIAIYLQPGIAGSLRLGFTLPHWSPPDFSDFRRALPTAALPQIPLTLLNSVIAVAALAADLFPANAPSPRTIATSVGLMNLLGGGFGAMPMCHGAGGLAGQYRFGARTNGSILILGAGKLLCAILFGGSLIVLCKAYPGSILGVLLVFSGLELALVVRDIVNRDEAFHLLVTAAVSLGLNNLALGVACGLLSAWIARITRAKTDEPVKPQPV